MPRMWAVEWRSNSGKKLFSLHRNRDDINVFAIRHNKGSEHADKISQVASPWQPTVSTEWYNYICDSAYGRIVNWRP